MRHNFTEKADLDKLDPYLKSLLHVLANKPLDATGNIADGKYTSYNFFNLVNMKSEAAKKKQKKGKKH